MFLISSIKFPLKIGQLTKLHIEHDNSGLLAADWFLDKVEVINMETNDTIVFPCDRWLCKKLVSFSFAYHVCYCL